MPIDVVDINECEMMSDLCDNDAVAVCTNTIGSYECDCKFGFTGDGFNCDGMLLIIINVENNCYCHCDIINTY